MQIPFMRLGLLCSTTVLLAACASAPKDISLIPTQTDSITSKEGVFTQPLKYELSKPNCEGTCPKIQVDSLIFPGNRVFTDFIDKELANMAGFDSRIAPRGSIQEFIDYYWVQAGDKDQTILSAKTRYRNKNLTVLELGAWQYMTGAAHGMSVIQLLNWDNQSNQPIRFDQIVLPNQHKAFEQRLREAHQNWLQTQDAYLDNPEDYARLWPFYATQNIALTDAGIVAKYNSYEIAPYSSGQPELFIPYTELRGILQPKYLP